jgi:3'(2'), 5'-bisphosphate nucleotidase
VRDADPWLASCRKQFTRTHAESQSEAHRRLFTDLYGTDVFDEKRFADGYRRFVEGVRDHFANRTNDLLILDVSAGEGWEKLCGFLERPVPDVPFPKANVTRIRWMSIDDVVVVARQAGLELLRRFDGRCEPDVRSPARRLFDAAIRTVSRGNPIDDAVRRADRVIVEGLARLNSRIPVVSRTSAAVAYSERRQWNHCWLVDPLDGEGAFAQGSRDFSVNIGLIEDGRAIYGVVHSPATDTTCYGRAGKGSYRRTDGRDPVPLGQKKDTLRPVEGDRSTGDFAAVTPGHEGSSRALAICNLAECGPTSVSMPEGSMEWHTAAAQAIVWSAGMRLCDASSGKELCYNKRDFANAAIKVVHPPSTELTSSPNHA